MALNDANNSSLSNFELVREFHEKFSVPILAKPQIPDRRRVDLRLTLIEEETDELYDALVKSKDVVEVADALADLLYVVYGAAHEFGIQIDAVFAEVHRSNMSKLGADSKPITRPSDGKVLKGPNFEQPQIAAILESHDNKPL